MFKGVGMSQVYWTHFSCTCQILHRLCHCWQGFTPVDLCRWWTCGFGVNGGAACWTGNALIFEIYQ